MSHSDNCLICGGNAEIIASSDESMMYLWNCEFCGRYMLADYVTGTLSGTYNIGKFDLIKLKSALFYYLRVVKKNHLNLSTDIITISANKHMENSYIELSAISALYPTQFGERLDMILELMATHITDLGVRLLVLSQSQHIAGSAGNIFFLPSVKPEEQDWQREYITDILQELKYITNPIPDQPSSPLRYTGFTFTSKGWKKVDFLQRRRDRSKTVFVAMSFNFKNPIIQNAEQCIKEAITKAGYIPRIISDKEHNNFIMDEIIYEIKNARFIIADLTEQKTGVYYEAGYAKALGKEVIFTCHESDFSNRHFDIAQINTIQWNDEEKFINDLVRRMEITVGVNK